MNLAIFRYWVSYICALRWRRRGDSVLGFNLPCSFWRAMNVVWHGSHRDIPAGAICPQSRHGRLNWCGMRLQFVDGSGEIGATFQYECCQSGDCVFTGFHAEPIRSVVHCWCHDQIP